MTPANHDGQTEHQINWGECIYDHLTGFFGEAFYSEKFEQASNLPSIQILAFRDVFGGCYAFCSFGLSKYRHLLREVAEVCIAVDDGWDETPNILAAALFAIVQRQIHLRSGIALYFRDWQPSFVEFASQFEKPAIYITVPPRNLPTDFGHIVCGNETAQLYLAFYISENEYNYYVKHGADKFEDLLEASDVDVFNIRRVSVV